MNNTGNNHILVVDDEQEMLVNYNRILSRAGYSVKTVLSGNDALGILETDSSFTLAICDLNMPGMDGITLVKRLKEKHPYLPVIMVTGYGSLEQGIEAIKTGVFDFIEKPFSREKLLKSVGDALAEIRPEALVESGPTSMFDNMIGQSQPMRNVFELVQKVGFGNANIMVTGESGVGKELVVRSIHKHSLRRNQPLIPINCGALPAPLFESELFGYEKGAFTGAFQAKPGLTELAMGGTLFLDEICEMPQELQVKLLRMLEDRKIRRIGGKTEIPVDVRIITATNRDPQECVEQGLLREDLYFRINTIHIQVPSLRERDSDIMLLADHFIQKLDQKYHRGIKSFSEDAQQLLHQYKWPGNVRELLNISERAYYLATPPQVTASDLPANLKNSKTDISFHQWDNLTYKEAKDQVLESFELDYLQYQLEKYDWNISRTAEACDVDRRTIHRLINRANLKK